MMDRSVPWIRLAMALDDLDSAPRFALPARYGLRGFQPGDERFWAEIERSAGEFQTVEDAVKRFRREFPGDEELDTRMLFLTDGGVPFATATAWRGEDSGQGRLHWVGVDASHQGRGLSRPLTSLALERMRALGHRSAFLTTQTASWVAIRVYHQFGFRPMLREPSEREGWRIVSGLTGIDMEV